MCSWSFSFCVVPPALRRKDVVKESSFLQFLPKWRFPNSTQQKCAKKIIAEHWIEGGKSRVFYRMCFTHTDTLFQFLLHSSQQISSQTWPGTGTRRMVLVMLVPHFTHVGIFLSLFFRLFFTCSSDPQSGAAAEQWHLGNTQNCVHSCGFSPGTARALTFLGNIFFLTSIDFRSFAYQSEV